MNAGLPVSSLSRLFRLYDPGDVLSISYKYEQGYEVAFAQNVVSGFRTSNHASDPVELEQNLRNRNQAV
jgi:hypothetical protein